MDEDSRPALLIADSSVLIDYWNGDRNLLRTISVDFAPILIPRPIFDEVEQLTRGVCASLELDIIEPTRRQREWAANQLRKLSFGDHLCARIAQEIGATCLTNDGGLRNECRRLGVQAMWGLEPLIYLVNSGHVSGKSAMRAIRKMQEKNRFITQDIVEDFSRRIRWENS